MERLLSDDKLRIFRDRSGGDVSQLKELITEQDLKSVAARDKEWVEWGESLPHPDCYGKCDIKNFCNNTSCFWQNWQSRRKEIGI